MTHYLLPPGTPWCPSGRRAPGHVGADPSRCPACAPPLAPPPPPEEPVPPPVAARKRPRRHGGPPPPAPLAERLRVASERDAVHIALLALSVRRPGGTFAPVSLRALADLLLPHRPNLDAARVSARVADLINAGFAERHIHEGRPGVRLRREGFRDARRRVAA